MTKEDKYWLRVFMCQVQKALRKTLPVYWREDIDNILDDMERVEGTESIDFDGTEYEGQDELIIAYYIRKAMEHFK